jgi:hypothetical protein
MKFKTQAEYDDGRETQLTAGLAGQLNIETVGLAVRWLESESQ